MFVKNRADYSEKCLSSKQYIFSSLLAGGVIAAGVSATAAMVNAGIKAKTEAANRAAQADANAANIAAQKEINAANIAAQKETNAANIASQEKINAEQLDYARSMTQAQWERDDNAHQREVADLLSAGLSPLASTHGSAVTSAQTWNPVAPHSEAPQSQALPNQLAYAAQAPQIDSNAFVQSILKSAELYEDYSKHQDKMINEGKSLELQAEQLSLNLEKINKEYEINKDNYNLNLQRFTHSVIIDNENLQLAIKQFEHAKTKDEKEQIIKTFCAETEQVQNALSDATKAGHYSSTPYIIKGYADLVNYKVALENWTKKYNTFLESKALSKKSSKGFSLGLGAGSHSGSNSGGGAGDSIGWTTTNGGSSSGGNVNIGVSGSSSTNSNRELQLLKKFYAENPYPVAVYRGVFQ